MLPYTTEPEMQKYAEAFLPFMPSSTSKCEEITLIVATQYNIKTYSLHILSYYIYSYRNRTELVNPVFYIWPQILILITPSVTSCSPHEKGSFCVSDPSLSVFGMYRQPAIIASKSDIRSWGWKSYISTSRRKIIPLWV